MCDVGVGVGVGVGVCLGVGGASTWPGPAFWLCPFLDASKLDQIRKVQFSVIFRTRVMFIVNFVVLRMDFDENLSEFHEIAKNVLARVCYCEKFFF